jgi:SUMO ligase MMS21 Smc5/6 complex component
MRASSSSSAFLGAFLDIHVIRIGIDRVVHAIRKTLETLRTLETLTGEYDAEIVDCMRNLQVVRSSDPQVYTHTS